MNSFETINQIYLRPSRTIEKIAVTNSTNRKNFFLYNYEGYSYRVFKSEADLNHFLENGKQSSNHSTTEKQLDAFLARVDIAKK